MDFKEFSKQITKVKKMELPGEALHFDMAPIERLKELKKQASEAREGKMERIKFLVLLRPQSLFQDFHFFVALVT